MNLVIKYNSQVSCIFSWGQWGRTELDVNILWDSRVALEHEKLSFRKIELKVTIHHPSWNITGGMHKFEPILWSHPGGKTSTVEWHPHGNELSHQGSSENRKKEGSKYCSLRYTSGELVRFWQLSLPWHIEWMSTEIWFKPTECFPRNSQYRKRREEDVRVHCVKGCWQV